MTAPALQELPVDRLYVDKVNPRPAPGDITDLAASIANLGVLNPLIVRPGADTTGSWGILSGQRRWTAARTAGLHVVPCIVRDLPDDQDALDVAVAEQIGRKSLSPLETANVFRAMLDAGRTQAQVAAKVGMSAASVSLYQRLVDLPEDIQAKIESGELGLLKAIDQHGRRYRKSTKPRGRHARRRDPDDDINCGHRCPNGHELVAIPSASLAAVTKAGRELGLQRDTLVVRILDASVRKILRGVA